ncbi:DUF421 domain-containing protein [Alkalibaculum sp. M08DMB]|uniref:DUF421 domain-containing protein n=1 Tax=Alkalibaculum sporogenes TaxID=2655001 RepID=A0A6A7K6Z3_9FIRM|nr:DUF421 domain-containing protein [Alkalibaculum sporogenes]MPW25101.1 DUF421 domain-containing protein [Alkalibaculum sporogenes]
MEVYVTIFFRILTIMILLLFSTIFIMGKRPIGELPVFDFLSIIVLGAIVGADIADPNIEHMPTVFAVILLALFQRLVSHSIMKSNKLRKIISFEPTVIIENGKLIQKNINKINYSIDDILMLLREKDVFDMSVIHYGIIESNGNISILKKRKYKSITLKDMNLESSEANIYYSIIIDGKLQREKLKEIEISEKEIFHKLQGQGINKYSEVFYASISKDGEINISTYNENERKGLL